MERFKIHVEKVYANSYHQNLLLNLPKVLHISKQITNISLRRLRPQTESCILQWEAYNGVFLPNDMKDFYIAHDGFLFLWTYVPIPDGSPVQCGIKVNCLNDMYAITGYEVTNKAGISMKNGRKALTLSANSKVFELEPMGVGACVCLVYYNVWLRPTIWLWSRKNGFFFLSRDFTNYMRMCIAHLGIIGWQYTFTPMVLPKWTRRIMRKIAPHLLRSPYHTIVQQEQSQNKQKRQSKNAKMKEDIVLNSRKAQEEDEIVINKLDPAVFSNNTLASLSWVSINGSPCRRTNSNSTMLHHLNIKKSRPLSVVSNVRSNSILKKGRCIGKKPQSSRSTTAYYNRRYIASPNVLRRSKYSKK